MLAPFHPIRRRFAWVFSLLAGLLLLTHIATIWFTFSLALDRVAAFVVGHGAFGLFVDSGGLDYTTVHIELNDHTTEMLWWFEQWGIMGMGYAGAPLWLPTLLFAALAGLMWYLAVRTRPGRCPACGYDLQGLPAGQPCPECGLARNASRPTPQPASQPAPRTHPQQPPGPAAASAPSPGAPPAPRNPSGPAAG